MNTRSRKQLPSVTRARTGSRDNNSRSQQLRLAYARESNNKPRLGKISFSLPPILSEPCRDKRPFEAGERETHTDLLSVSTAKEKSCSLRRQKDKPQFPFLPLLFAAALLPSPLQQRKQLAAEADALRRTHLDGGFVCADGGTAEAAEAEPFERLSAGAGAEC